MHLTKGKARAILGVWRERSTPDDTRGSGAYDGGSAGAHLSRYETPNPALGEDTMTPRRMSSGSPEGLTYSFPELDVDALLREMVLYIAKRSADDPRFGATKLNKLLWWADFLSYGMRGKPITGTAYMRLPQGQVPRRLVPVRAQLIAADHLFIESRPYYGLEQYRPVAKRDADLSAFSGEDVALVDRIIEAFWNVSASAMGDISHGHAWKSAEDGEDVPYEMIFLSDESPTEEDILRARELADRYGWDE